jgi:PrtD family type I secretion system ABC transporter
MPVSGGVERVDRSGTLVASALAACTGAFTAAGVLSGAINVLMLTGALFMLQVYDRVLPSRSVPTLVALTALVAAAYVFQALFDFIRGRILVRIGRLVDEELGGYAYKAISKIPLSARAAANSLAPVRDLDQVRGFLSSSGPSALFDLPWVPIYLAVCFLLHFWIGVTALVGAVLLTGLTLLTEACARQPTAAASKISEQRLTWAEGVRRNAEVVRAMAMSESLERRWQSINSKYMNQQQKAADISGGLGALARALRFFLQSAVLAVGAFLVIYQEATAGAIIAGSILTSRALAPIELAIANWKNFLTTRQSWRRLEGILPYLQDDLSPLALSRPRQRISIEQVSAAPPTSPKPILQEVTFELKRGQGLGIIGPSASGKSTLVRTIVGIWPAVRGKVRIDDAALEQWAELGNHVGYLPQDIELFAGSIAENIARFHPEPKSEAIVAAAQAAGVHELVLRLPNGYETLIGEGGAALSAGQRQRIALARALYGDPFLVVLDEPSSNLDADGDLALARAVSGVKERQGIVIIVSHRPASLINIDLVLALGNGRVLSFGPKDEVFSKVLDRSSAPRSDRRGTDTSEVAAS